MQTCLLLLGIVLTGQLNETSENRYLSLQENRPAYGRTAYDGTDYDGTDYDRTAYDGTTEAAPQISSQPPVQYPAQNPATRQPFDNNPLRTATPPATHAAPRAQLAKVIKPVELLRSLTKPVGAEKLVGVPLSLSEAVRSARTRAEQTRRVKLYWELSQTVADYRLIALETVQLNSIYDGLGLLQSSPVWQQTQQTLATRRRVALSAVRVVQLRLQKELAGASENDLPLPTDLPYCGAYETRFDEIFRGRNSREAQQLSELLPLRLQELGQRSLDTMAAHEWYNLNSQKRSPQSEGAGLLKAYENLALQRRTFVSTAYQYNANIARYTELAVPQQVNSDRLVAMLIRTRSNSTGEEQRGSIQQATAVEDMPQDPSERNRPRTYAERGRNSVLRVPSDKKKGEHSILVKPKGSGR